MSKNYSLWLMALGITSLGLLLQNQSGGHSWAEANLRGGGKGTAAETFYFPCRSYCAALLDPCFTCEDPQIGVQLPNGMGGDSGVFNCGMENDGLCQGVGFNQCVTLDPSGRMCPDADRYENQSE